MARQSYGTRRRPSVREELAAEAKRLVLGIVFGATTLLVVYVGLQAVAASLTRR